MTFLNGKGRKPKLQTWVFCFLNLFYVSTWGAEHTRLLEIEPWKKMGSRLVDQTSVQLAVAGAGSSLWAAGQDHLMRERFSDHQQMSPPFSRIGTDYLGTGIASTLILTGQYFFDAEKENFDSHARALVGNILATAALKRTFQRRRPGKALNPHLTSYPSGHTSTAFATATALTYAYGAEVGYIAFPLAAFTGFCRIADDVHWFSDTVGGAFVGFIFARAAYLKGNNQTTWNFIPVIDRDDAGFLFSREF